MSKDRIEEAHRGAALGERTAVAPPPGERAEELRGYSTQELYAELLARFDEDPTRDGLLKTR